MRLFLWLTVPVLALVLAAVASSSWWIPILTKHLVAKQLAEAGITDAQFDVSTVSLYHLELTEFSGQWRHVRFEIGRAEVAFDVKELRAGHLQRLDFHNARVVLEQDDTGNSPLLTDTIADLPVDSVFLHSGTLCWETYSTKEPTVFEAECTFERDPATGIRSWIRLEHGNHFLEISRNTSPSGSGEISFDASLNMPILQILSQSTLPTIPFMGGMKWSDLRSRTGRLKAEGRIGLHSQGIGEWVFLGELNNLQFDRQDGKASANLNIAARGQGMAFIELVLKANGDSQVTSATPAAVPTSSAAPVARYHLEYKWDTLIEFRNSNTAGKINLTLTNSTLLLDDATPRLRIYEISGATAWTLQGTSLVIDQPTSLPFSQAELPGISMRSGILTLSAPINIADPVAIATLASSVSYQQEIDPMEDRIIDGEVELPIRIDLRQLFPTAFKAFEVIRTLPVNR